MKPIGYMQILSVESDPKTVKGQARGYLTGICYLAPSTASGVMDTCPKASKGCKRACLFTAGKSGIFRNINQARIARTRMLHFNRELFLACLAYDIESLIRRANKRGLIPCVRPNGMSDLPWLGQWLARRYPTLQVYDYTAIPNPARRQLPNYHLTFSRKENNWPACVQALAEGISATVVFNVKHESEFPATYMGYPVVSGDSSDLRFLDPRGHIIALKAKGKAKQDTSGFVQLVSIQTMKARG